MVKAVITFGVIASAFLIPQMLIAPRLGQPEAPRLQQTGLQQTGIDAEYYQTQPNCDPVNDPSSCRSS